MPVKPIPDGPMTDQYYRDRMGILTDPFGHKWTIGIHIEDVPVEEVERRFEETARKHE